MITLTVHCTNPEHKRLDKLEQGPRMLLNESQPYNNNEDHQYQYQCSICTRTVQICLEVKF